MCVGFVAIFFLKEIPLRGASPGAASSQASEGAVEASASATMMH